MLAREHREVGGEALGELVDADRRRRLLAGSPHREVALLEPVDGRGDECGASAVVVRRRAGGGVCRLIDRAMGQALHAGGGDDVERRVGDLGSAIHGASVPNDYRNSAV